MPEGLRKMIGKFMDEEKEEKEKEGEIKEEERKEEEIAQPEDTEFAEVKRTLSDAVIRIQKLEGTANILKKDMEEMKSEVERTRHVVDELASIYEVIVNQINPFAGESKLSKANLFGAVKSRRKEPVQPQVVVEEKKEEKEEKKEPEKPIALQPVERPPEEYILRDVNLDNFEKVLTFLFWLKFLTSKLKREAIDDVLNYYEDIGWLSPEALSLINTYLRGISTTSKKGLKSNLNAEEHQISLRYITMLK